MKLWLDDLRPAPEGWVHARSVNAAIQWLLCEEITEASLDHDLGAYARFGGDGTRLVDFMTEQNIWPKDGVKIHLGNPVGRDNMLRTIARYSPYN